MKLCLLALILFASLEATQLKPTPGKIRALYNSLEAHSISQHLAFYQLYPETEEGHQALNHAWNLLAGQKQTAAQITAPPLNSSIVDSIVKLVNKQADNEVVLSDEEQQVIDRLAAHLPNRKLKGYRAISEREVLALPPKRSIWHADFF